MRIELLHDLKRDEGFKLKAYKDSVGLWTIGIGHLLGETLRMAEITEQEAYALFNQDVELAIVGARQLFDYWDLITPVRQDALINMTFNLGPTRLAGFKKFIAAVNAKMWNLAAQEMMDSKWAKQVGDRALRLKHMIQTGERQ